MDRVGSDIQEVARSRLERLCALRAELHPQCPGYNVRARLVLAMVVPTRQPSGVGSSPTSAPAAGLVVLWPRGGTRLCWTPMGPTRRMSGPINVVRPGPSKSTPMARRRGAAAGCPLLRRYRSARAGRRPMLNPRDRARPGYRAQGRSPSPSRGGGVLWAHRLPERDRPPATLPAPAGLTANDQRPAERRCDWPNDAIACSPKNGVQGLEFPASTSRPR